ncbi:metallo-dependent phosphatase [Pseudoalteromonas phage J2-1_QLiu-2017]|nr:metallo-dependent phosphatase [Pseudoalteromonas phage J2-1_QLiu-2017]
MKNELVRIVELMADGMTKQEALERLKKEQQQEENLVVEEKEEIKKPTLRSVDLDSEDCVETLTVSGDPLVAKLAKKVRNLQVTNNELRRTARASVSNTDYATSIFKGIEKASQSVSQADRKTVYLSGDSTVAQNATLEVLLSDLQIGKVTRDYNTPEAKKRLARYRDGIMQAIFERNTKYNLERIVVALIGDLVEDHMKHGVKSASSCDTGLSEQMHDAIEGIFLNIIEPLAASGLPMDVMCVTGNHGSSEHKGMDSFKAGRFSYDFVIHKTLERYCQLSGYNNVTFHIPDGVFGHLDIYGSVAIYEHGYNNNITEKAMVDQMRKRGAQIQQHPTFWRQGDKHHHITYGQGEQVLNGAFFGVDSEGLEYSGILGFSSVPSQTIMFHTDKNKQVGLSSVDEVINIQLVKPD